MGYNLSFSSHHHKKRSYSIAPDKKKQKPRACGEKDSNFRHESWEKKRFPQRGRGSDGWASSGEDEAKIGVEDDRV